jgi:TonB family protein
MRLRRRRRQSPEIAMSDIDLEQKPSRWLWLFAGVAALALHVGGGAFAVAHLRDADEENALGAAGIEIALEMSSPKSEETDLPPGPDSDASVASPALAEQKAEVKETDLPKDTPTEEAEADRMVTPNNVKKPIEEEEKVAKVETEASQESVAAEASARQPLEDAREAKTVTAPNPGMGKDKHVMAAKWQNQISAYFQQHLRYPEVKQTRDANVVISIVLDRAGHVVSYEVVESSGDPRFDEAAKSMIRRSDPVPRPPAGLTDDTFTFALPVKFNKRRAG